MKMLYRSLAISVILVILAIGHCCASDFYDAVRFENLATIQKFVSKNPALVNQPDLENYGRLYPLHYVMLRDCSTWEKVNEGIDIIKYLLAHGANINCRDINGGTPIYQGIQHQKNTLTRYLISRGANVNNESNDGFTPLHVAADTVQAYPQWDLTELLISKGAKVNAVDKYGRTPLSYAIESKNAYSEAILRRHGAKDLSGKIIVTKQAKKEQAKNEIVVQNALSSLRTRHTRVASDLNELKGIIEQASVNYHQIDVELKNSKAGNVPSDLKLATDLTQSLMDMTFDWLKSTKAECLKTRKALYATEQVSFVKAGKFKKEIADLRKLVAKQESERENLVARIRTLDKRRASLLVKLGEIDRVSRKQFAQMICKMTQWEGTPGVLFEDMPANDPDVGQVATLVQKHVLEASSHHFVRPNTSITRYEVATAVAGVFKECGVRLPQRNEIFVVPSDIPTDHPCYLCAHQVINMSMPTTHCTGPFEGNKWITHADAEAIIAWVQTKIAQAQEQNLQ